MFRGKLIRLGSVCWQFLRSISERSALGRARSTESIESLAIERRRTVHPCLVLGDSICTGLLEHARDLLAGW